MASTLCGRAGAPRAVGPSGRGFFVEPAGFPTRSAWLRSEEYLAKDGMTKHPAVDEHLVVSFPHDHILLLRLNRPKKLNAMTPALEDDLRKMLDWADDEPSVWAVVVTGTGRAFCAGQDLKGWNDTAGTDDSPPARMARNPHGFGSISRRRMKKPLIAAANGIVMGGGAEMIVNSDISIGVRGALFGFPEVKRGVTAAVGGIPNAMRRSPILAAYLLSGEPIKKEEHLAHIFTELVDTTDEVLPRALDWARKIVDAAPEAVWATKEQIVHFKEGAGTTECVQKGIKSELTAALFDSENYKEGLAAFNEKRDPAWKNPKTRSSKL